MKVYLNFILLLLLPVNGQKNTCKSIGNNPATCDAHVGCVFCAGGWANTHGCYTKEAAARLPPGMFHCDNTTLATRPTSTPFPTANVTTTFSCTTNQQCNVGFPGCFSGMDQGYTIEMAVDTKNLMETYGPTSMLPSTENNQIINRWDLGFKYSLWINGQGTSKTIINCTKLNVSGEHMTAERLRSSILGYSFRATNNGKGTQVACSLNSTRMGHKCNAWTWLSEFGCGQAGGHQALGQEPEVWTTTAGGTKLTAMTNDIYYPKVCTSDGGPTHIAASIDYTENWSGVVDPAVFDVPKDCPLVDDLDEWKGHVNGVLLKYV